MKRLYYLCISLLLSLSGAIVGWAQNEFPELSEANPQEGFHLTTGQYKAAIENGEGGWKASGTHKIFAFKGIYADTYFKHDGYSFGQKDYTYDSRLASPALRSSAVAGGTVSFDWAGGSAKGTVPSIVVKLIKKDGTEIAELGKITAAVGQNIKDWHPVTFSLPASIEGEVCFVTFTTKGSYENRANYCLRELKLEKAGMATFAVTFTPTAALEFDRIAAGEQSVQKKVQVAVHHASADVDARIEGIHANEFAIAAKVLNREGGQVNVVFVPKTFDKDKDVTPKEAKLVIFSGENRAELPLKGLAIRGSGVAPSPDPTPQPSEGKELLEDPYLYEFNDNTPKKWTIENATPRRTEGREAYHSDTGFGLELTTTDKVGVFSQKIAIVKEGKRQIEPGQMAEGLLHYYTHAESGKPYPLSLRMRWLDANGNELATAEKGIMNNPEIIFGKRQAWGTFMFRTICPAGSTHFEFAITVAADSKVRLDDFGFRVLGKNERNPFVAILPQTLTLEALKGQPLTTAIAMQSYDVEGKTDVSLLGGPLGLSCDVMQLEANTTKTAKLTLNGNTIGRYHKLGENFFVKLAAGDNVASLLLAAYIGDPDNKPVIKLAEPFTETFACAPKQRQEKEIKIAIDGRLVDDVHLRVENVKGNAFRINTSSFIYNDKTGKLYGSFLKAIYAPQEAGQHEAVIVLTTRFGNELRIPLKGEAPEEIVENFTAAREMDKRFTGTAWLGYNLFDIGYWYLDGIYKAESKSVLLNANGKLYYDEWFPNGVVGISVKTVAGATAPQLEYSFDGGGHWTKAENYQITTKRPTLIRLVNNSNVAVEIEQIGVQATKVEERAAFSKIEEAFLRNADTKALDRMDETFNGKRHTRTLSIDGWQNLPVRAERPFMAWQVKDKAQDKVTDEAAQISFLAWGKEDKREHETWLLSPTLSMKGAKSKIMTLRVRFDLPTDNPREKFGVWAITEGEQPKSVFIDLNEHMPVVDPSDKTSALAPGTWLDYYIDLGKVKELEDVDLFHIAFSYYSPVGGNETSLTFYIDDVTFGRDDLPVLSTTAGKVTVIKARPGVKSDPVEIGVAGERTDSAIKLTLLPEQARKFFKLSVQELPKEGGQFEIVFKADEKKEYPALLLAQSRGAAPLQIKLLGTTKEISAIDAATANTLFVYPTVTRSFVTVSGSYRSYAIYTLDGVAVAQGESAAQISLVELPAAQYIILLQSEDGKLAGFPVVKE